ncbi:MAG: alkaline phosphatase family protein [Caldilineales bacterium]|nr:alkaline phosphatase family protein [Caldilineales bacterium]
MSPTEPAARLLVIGLDGGTWDVFGPLCDLGEMPNLARLRANSVWSPLLSTQPPFTAPAWATFTTGVNPGKHGVLHFLQKPDDPAASLRGEGVPINSTFVRSPDMWAYFNAAGRSVGSINMPLSYPLAEINGFSVSGMLTPPDVRDWTRPPDLASELPGYIVDLDYGRPGQTMRSEELPSLAQLLADVTNMTERRGFNAIRLIQTRPWDVFSIVFTGTDRIFHHFWHYVQPDEAEDGYSLDVKLANGLQNYFRLLDNILGSLIRSAGSNANVVIMSDHGFGPAAVNWTHLNNWVLELGVLRLRSGGDSWVQRMKKQSPWLRDIAKRILPAEARDAVRRAGHLADAVDWAQTQAWVEPLYNNVAGLYLNRADRYADGIVKPDQVDALRRKLTEEAHKLRIPGTDTPLVLDVQTREQLYRGPYVERFPDLILTLDLAHVVVPTLGSTLITPVTKLVRSGDHRPEGMFLASGPNIARGRLETTPHLLDLAPTLLCLAGLPVPESMDGDVIVSALSPQFLAKHPPQSGPSLAITTPPTALSDLESNAINQRLRSLGYL